MSFCMNVNTFQKISGQHGGPGHIWDTATEPQIKPSDTDPSAQNWWRTPVIPGADNPPAQ